MVTDPILTGKICPYCLKETELIDSAELYGKSYGLMYICQDCDAYVGCYRGTTTVLGRLANAELREAKKRAHHYLDQLWESGKYHKHGTYTWLSKQLGIPRELTHIGMSDIEQCNRIANIRLARLKHDNIEFIKWPDDTD